MIHSSLSHSTMYTCILHLFLFTIFTLKIEAFIMCPPVKPDQIRLAFAGDTGVNIGWHIRTCWKDFVNINPNPTVVFGTDNQTLTFKSVKGKSNSYDNHTVLGKSWFYSVELQNLLPSTLYYYQIAASNYTSASDIFSFTSAPKLGDQSRPVRIAMYADFGLDGFIDSTTQSPFLFQIGLYALKQKLSEFDFIMHHGDICYADDGPILLTPRTYEQAMDECQARMASITTTRFLMVAVGNHEINCTNAPVANEKCPPDHTNQIPYSYRFNMPSEQSGGYWNTWYSFNYGLVHVISLSTESDFPGAPSNNLLDNTTQINWLKKDLAAVDRAITPWVVVHGHRPWKGSTATATKYTLGITNCPACRQAFESILNESKVDIYITGHVHWYERICLNGTINTTNYVNPDGPVYLTNGAIGNPERGETVQTRSNDSCLIITDPSFGILNITDASQATFTLYQTSDLTQRDQFTIIKNR